MNELPHEASITYTIFDARLIRGALEPIFSLDLQSQSQDLCPPRFTLHLLRAWAFIIRHLRARDSCCSGCAIREIRFKTKGRRAGRQLTLKSESGRVP